MKPYYEDSLVTLYHGDARAIIPNLGRFDAIITDPVWPNSVFPNVPDPANLLFMALNHADAERVVVHLGCDSDPRFLSAVPERWTFLRVCDLDYARPGYKGRIVYGGDIAYVFGQPPPTIPHGDGRTGMKMLPGRCISTRSDPAQWRRSRNGVNKRYTRDDYEALELPHPCPRRVQHVQWLAKWFGGASVLDPFIGSGTTAVACKALGIPCVGIDIESKYLDVAIDRLRQETLELIEATP